MPAISVQLRPWDPSPYKNFRYRLRADDGRYLGGFSKCRGLDDSVDVVDYQAVRGSVPSRRLPHLRTSGVVTLELGLTRDADFAKWVGLASQTWRRDRRRDLIVEVCNEIGKVALTYALHRAWVTSFQGVPDLDANANAVSITALTLNNEGKERK